MARAMEQGMDVPVLILPLPGVEARTGQSRSTIYVRVAEGSFPKPVCVVGWVEADVDAWIRQQTAGKPWRSSVTGCLALYRPVTGTTYGSRVSSVQELGPLLHQGASAFKEVRAGVGRFHLVADDVRQRRLHDRMGRVRTLRPPNRESSTGTRAARPQSPAPAADR